MLRLIAVASKHAKTAAVASKRMPKRGCIEISLRCTGAQGFRLYSQKTPADPPQPTTLEPQPRTVSVMHEPSTSSEAPQDKEAENPAVEKEELLPLTKHIRDLIKIQGPMSVSHYMRQVLVNPLAGYYMKGDVFGAQGDFITSPEVSQMFGELMAIWYIMQWQGAGKPKDIQLVEIGPGRGTLMMDMLRVVNRFKEFRQAVSSVHLVEASPGLRKIQRERLCNIPTSMDQVDGGSKEGITQAQRADGLQVYWHDVFTDLPKKYSFIMAHEFFDALPVYKFEKTKDGWRELMVDLEEDKSSPYHLRFILSPGPTQASRAFAEHPAYDHFQVGDRIEISPDSFRVAHDMAQHIHKHGGSALVIDYGKDHIQGDTLRGIHKHQFTHVLTKPGLVDLSVDVDFNYLKEATEELADCHGSVPQGRFLHSMGIGARLDMLLRKATTRELRKNLVASYARLVDPKQMGEVYRVMAMTPLGSPTPVGFEPLSEIAAAESKTSREESLSPPSSSSSQTSDQKSKL